MLTCWHGGPGARRLGRSSYQPGGLLTRRRSRTAAATGPTAGIGSGDLDRSRRFAAATEHHVRCGVSVKHKPASTTPDRRLSRVATTAELSPSVAKRPSGKAGSPAGQSRLLRLAVVGAHQHNDVIGDAF